ncbi:MAG: hypothetical protein J7641_23850 [Cyanobacteria bacterium SID2]|nr:hypothetical protein [Cyanobacteria bacterium SID2]MBP0005944.1 hypothetical protein [Cyanobacteria bacterium SBC]
MSQIAVEQASSISFRENVNMRSMEKLLPVKYFNSSKVKQFQKISMVFETKQPSKIQLQSAKISIVQTNFHLYLADAFQS